jgi:hypothetical protein
MSVLLFITGVALLTGFGLPFLRIEALRALPLTSRIATGFAFGQLVAATLMTVMSAIHVEWSRAAIGVALAAALAATPWRALHDRERIDRQWRPLAMIATAFAMLSYGVATARVTCADLLYFWGPKGQRFFEAEGIDVEFLRFPHYYLMHPDYPPVMTVVYAWGSEVAHRFTLWGALWLTPLYLLAATAIFFGFARTTLGDRRAAIHSALFTALLAYGYAASRAAGGADPLLLLFEATALGASTFSERRGRWLVTGLALAGAAMTKVEGAAFAAAMLLAIALTRRSLRALVVSALPFAAALAAWIAFVRHHGLVDAYGRGTQPLLLGRLGYVLKMTMWQAMYRAYWLPWFAALAPLALGRNFRRAALPLIVAALSFLYVIYFYLHDPEPLWWIRTSAERVLLTTLLSLLFAGAAAADLDPSAMHSLESRARWHGSVRKRSRKSRLRSRSRSPKVSGSSATTARKCSTGRKSSRTSTSARSARTTSVSRRASASSSCSTTRSTRSSRRISAPAIRSSSATPSAIATGCASISSAWEPATLSSALRASSKESPSSSLRWSTPSWAAQWARS